MKFAKSIEVTGQETAPNRRGVGNEGSGLVFASDKEIGLFAGERSRWAGDIQPVKIGDSYLGRFAALTGVSDEDAARVAEGDISALSGYLEVDPEGVMSAKAGMGVRLYVATGHFAQPRPNIPTPIETADQHLALAAEYPETALNLAAVNTLQELIPATTPGLAATVPYMHKGH